MKTLLTIIFVGIAISCIGQIDKDDARKSARSMEVRTGLTNFASFEGAVAPFIGIGVQTMKNGWILAAEFTHHWEYIRQKKWGDSVPFRNSSHITALVGRQFAFELIKYNLTTGLGVLSERHPLPLSSRLGRRISYARKMGISWPVRLDVAFSRRPFGAGLFVFSNLNTQTSMIGGGIIIPLAVRPRL